MIPHYIKKVFMRKTKLNHIYKCIHNIIEKYFDNIIKSYHNTVLQLRFSLSSPQRNNLKLISCSDRKLDEIVLSGFNYLENLDSVRKFPSLNSEVDATRDTTGFSILLHLHYESPSPTTSSSINRLHRKFLSLD